MEKMQQKYAGQMAKIKSRIVSINKFYEIAHGQLDVRFVAECIYLQLRKILELIAMSSIVANHQEMKKLNQKIRDIRKEWHGDLILKMVEGINPDFYPVPAVSIPPDRLDIKASFEEKTGGFLSRANFTKLYKLCGSLMHADNPLGKETNYEARLKEWPNWEKLIWELLSIHRIRLVGCDVLYIALMNGLNNNPVTVITASRTSK